MNSKIATLVLALAFGGMLRAEEASHEGHDHSSPATKEAAGKDSPEAKRPAEAKEIKGASKQGKCKPHKAAKADCFICDPSLRDKGRLWCKEHSRYEDRCFLCHPEIKEAGRLYCEEHGLYEDECFLCHPELKKTGKPAAPGKGGATPAAPVTPKKG
jgi:hypothetical protein